MNVTVDVVRSRWKAIVTAAVALGVAFGVEVPEGAVDQSTELVAQMAAAGLGLYALGRIVWDRIQLRLGGSSNEG